MVEIGKTYAAMHTGATIGDLQWAGTIDPDNTWFVIESHIGNPKTLRVRGSQMLTRAQVMFCVPGTLSVDDDPAPWFICGAPNGVYITGIALVVKTPGTVRSIIVDVEKSTDGGTTWTSIFGEPWISGAHDGPEDSATLISGGGAFTTSMEGLVIERAIPHAATGTITTVISSTELLASFGDWDISTSDQYLIAIGGGILPSERVGIGASAVVGIATLLQDQLLRVGIEQADGADLTVSVRVSPL